MLFPVALFQRTLPVLVPYTSVIDATGDGADALTLWKKKLASCCRCFRDKEDYLYAQMRLVCHIGCVRRLVLFFFICMQPICFLFVDAYIKLRSIS